MTGKPTHIHNESPNKVLIIASLSTIFPVTPDVDKPACHICGSRRQRNLIISFTKSKHQSIEDYLINPMSGDKHVICYRCESLNLSVDDLRYMKDRYFPGQMRKYKDLKQKMTANSHKRNMGGEG